MTEPLQPFPQFIHFLEQVELCADRVAWSSIRIRGELRSERRLRMRDAEQELHSTLSKASRFLDYLARQKIITTDGADDLASFLLTSAREVIRETKTEQAWGWAPKHGRRDDAETLWIRAQVENDALQAFGGEAMARLMHRLKNPTKEVSCGKH